MPSSLYNGRITFQTTVFATSGAPVATHELAKLGNNYAHFGDSSAQVLACWTPIDDTDGYTLRDDGSGAPDSLLYTDRPFGPYPIRIRPDQSTYRIRVLVAAFETAGAPQTFRVVLAKPGDEELERDRAGTHRTDVTVPASGTGPEWISPAASTIWHGAGFVSTAMELVHPRIYDEDADPLPIQMLPLGIYVFNVSETPTLTAKLCGLLAAEFVGP